MKNLILIGGIAGFLFSVTSCGHTTCDAYGGQSQLNVSKHKAEKQIAGVSTIAKRIQVKADHK